jgi:hypothetical protein
MFDSFKDDKPTELSKYINDLTKEINHNGGAKTICVNFLNFLDKDELFNTLFIFNEGKFPQSKSTLALSALMLLNDIKKSKEKADDLNELAKASFIFSSSSVNDAELAELLLMPSTKALEVIKQRREPYEAAWNEWLATDIDIDKLASIVLNKFE